MLWLFRVTCHVCTRVTFYNSTAWVQDWSITGIFRKFVKRKSWQLSTLGYLSVSIDQDRSWTVLNKDMYFWNWGIVFHNSSQKISLPNQRNFEIFINPVKHPFNTQAEFLLWTFQLNLSLLTEMLSQFTLCAPTIRKIYS